MNAHAGPGDFRPLPPYADPRQALAEALPNLRPPRRIGVCEAAERHLKVELDGQWQDWDRRTTPYMAEPTDQMSSRRYRAIIFAGPARSGKTVSLRAGLAHAIEYDPARIAFFQMSRDAAREFEENTLAPMLRHSPDLGARLATSTLYRKVFKGGTHLTLNWPVATQLASATYRTVMFTDYDRFPENVDGEGDAYTMARRRTQIAASRGMVIVESSPGSPIRDESWRPKTVHDCPPVRHGVLSLYPSGTRARWYWTCPDCGELFEPTFPRLVYPRDADPAEAAADVHMGCPECGVLIPHSAKRGLNEAGQWLHEAGDGKGIVPIGDPEIREAEALSYWLDGVAATFATWAGLVREFEEAKTLFAATGDEERLKSAVNTGQGRPYLPRSLEGDGEVSLDILRDKAEATPGEKGIAPGWARYLTITVDTQQNRWDVMVTAWGEHGRHQPIDRFDLHQPPDVAPGAGDRVVSPFTVAEDWDALIALEDLAYPVDGMGCAFRAVALAVDMQGGGATTANAYRFYRARRKAGHGRRWFLTRGRGGDHHRDRVWLQAPEKSSDKRRRAAKDIEILHIATDRVKDAVAVSLQLTEEGQNFCHIPAWTEEAHLVEATAERRTPKGWRKRPGMVRNETFDLLTQARALHIQKGGERLDPANLPPWAAEGRANINAVTLTPEEAAAADGTDDTQAETAGPRGVRASGESPRRRRRRGNMGF